MYVRPFQESFWGHICQFLSSIELIATQDLPEYEVLGRRKSVYKNSIKIKHLQVPTLSVENVNENNDKNLETLFHNGDSSTITYKTVSEELAMGSEVTGTPRSRRSLSTTASGGEDPATEKDSSSSSGGRDGI